MKGRGKSRRGKKKIKRREYPGHLERPKNIVSGGTGEPNVTKASAAITRTGLGELKRKNRGVRGSREKVSKKRDEKTQGGGWARPRRGTFECCAITSKVRKLKKFKRGTGRTEKRKVGFTNSPAE